MSAISFRVQTVRAKLAPVAEELQVKTAAARVMFGPGFSDRAARSVEHALGSPQQTGTRSAHTE